jgi:uncharacterized phage protein (TIGR02218 family)
VKSASAVLAAHLEQEVTALATCWRLTRTDGLVLGFTDHDRDLVIESLTYRAASAYSRSAIASRAGLAVDNLDLEGLLDSDAISEEELRAGRFDRAAVEVFLVNWQALGQGVVRLRRGTLGEVRLQGGLYRAELRGMAQALTAPAVEVYTPECRADLGDHRCQVDLAALTVPGSVASAADRRTFTTSDVTDPRHRDNHEERTRSINVSMTVVTRDADSFRRSQGQITAELAQLLRRAERNL